MDEAENGIVVNNPHDRLFRETWSNLENIRSFRSTTCQLMC